MIDKKRSLLKEMISSGYEDYRVAHPRLTNIISLKKTLAGVDSFLEKLCLIKDNFSDLECNFSLPEYLNNWSN